MKVDLFRDPKYTVKWPLMDEYPEEDKITFFCRRLTHSSKRRIEDGMLRVDSAAMESARKGRSEGMGMTMAIGTMKDQKIKDSILDWDNLLDKDGHKISYTWDKMVLLLISNADHDPIDFGHLETDLITEIDRQNNFADKTKLPEQNGDTKEGKSLTGSSTS